MDYISRDAARAIIEEQQKAVCYTGRWGRAYAKDVEKYDALEAVLDTIDEIPTADVAPVRHGKWVAREYGVASTTFRCSECGRTVDVCNDYFDVLSIHAAAQYPYCHCGAWMDGGAENGE